MNAQQLKNAILQEAIEGRLVPQDPNDEPASVLLARIRKEKERLVKEGKLKKKDLKVKPISEDEIPFEIPESWGWVRLKSLVSVLGDGIHGTPEYDITGGYYFINGNNLSNNKIVIKADTKKVNEKEYQTYKKELNDNTILVSINGTIGNVGHYNGEPIILGKSACYYNLLDISLKAYITMLMYTDYFLKYAVENATGSTIKNVSLAVMNDFLVPFPPVAEQHRIVAKIEELLPKVEEYGKAQDELNKLNAELPERLKKSILQEAIEGRLVPQNPNDEPASVLLDKIRQEKAQLVKAGKLKKKDLIETPIADDEIPFEIPASWEWVRFGEISTYAHTKKKINAAKADSNLWGLDLEDIEKGGRLLCIKTVGERKAIGDKTCFAEGDILYSKLRPYLLKILIAPKNGICTPEIIPFTCYKDINKNYIVSLLKSVYVDDYINSATFGVKMPRVATETMTSLVIPLPPLAEQHRIVEKLEQLLGKIDNLKR